MSKFSWFSQIAIDSRNEGLQNFKILSRGHPGAANNKGSVKIVSVKHYQSAIFVCLENLNVYSMCVARCRGSVS